ncbi:DUF533 domain-containing protein [Tropicimonas sp. IMCC34043]|uniref:DUF533 domain-containing protein n=1 Tax=Tropicimonas sp. IMCC34043 TaxID=2248760 RepID=UPI002711F04D|nr:DUF533 domain-containing protein [Tropicimonas sp. IMCC34043]
MSLVKTLAKVAVGVVVANSVKGMVSGGSRSGSARAGQASAGGGLQDMLGQMMGGGGGTQGGSLQDMLGQMMGGGAGARGGGGLQDMLGQMMGGGAGGPQGGGLQDMLGQILGGGAAAGGARGGGMGGMLDELSRMSRPVGAGTGAVAGAAAGAGGLGELLNQSLQRYGEPDRTPTRAEEEQAGLLLRAMIQAAKADGRIDEGEKRYLLDQLGDASPEEMAFVEAEMKRPIDAAALARDVPRGAEQQVYMVSAMAIVLDDQSEARYLNDLAKALRLDPPAVNAIHDRLGIAHIYR